MSTNQNGTMAVDSEMCKLMQLARDDHSFQRADGTIDTERQGRTG